MKTETFEVSSNKDGAEVETSITLHLPETFDEAVSTWTAERVFELARTQFVTNERNKARAALTAKLSKGRLKELAMERIMSDDTLRGEYLSVLKDSTKKEALIERVGSEIQAEYDNDRKQRLEAAAKEGD